ncbi:MAG: ATP-binding protein [Faecousia sp.]
MRIYKMTATFGKLEHETLTLEPGLNIIEAPNEWGKTTWCAFLITMFYGLDTRAKTTKTALADKEKYVPWSGSPMSGRIDLNWNGRDITIERSTKGRTPMGQFRAYETQSGIAIPELTAANCGVQLLGVEQSVYRRTGFIRQSEMPVIQDDALRRRLNALVTTGDETGDSDRLAAELKDLKNKCRYNRSGLLPQAENQKRELEEKRIELESLQLHSRKLKERLGEVKTWLRALENHEDALQYAAAEINARSVAEARDQRDQAEEKMTQLEQLCVGQPNREELEAKIRQIQTFREDLENFRIAETAVYQPTVPVPPEVFRGMTLEQAENMTEADCRNHERLRRGKRELLFLIPAFVCLLLGALALGMKVWAGAALLPAVLILLILGLRRRSARQQEQERLERKYGSGDPSRWMEMLRNYKAEDAAFAQAMQEYRGIRGDLDIRAAFLQKQREALFGSQSPERVLETWMQMLRRQENYEAACRDYFQLQKHLKTLQDLAGADVRKPAMEDTLTYSPEETQKLLAEAQAEQQRLQNRLGQYQGRMEALGDADALQRQLQEVEERVGRLEEIYEAAALALETLSQAKQELQRKFAPRISQRARDLLAQLTSGRYDRLTLGEDLSLLAGAGQEETLREILWRSDGTVDQLYLALRLAVAEELIGEVPLVLDDAFIRFDDTRLAAALEILKQESLQKQVILFTCQHREKELLA